VDLLFSIGRYLNNKLQAATLYFPSMQIKARHCRKELLEVRILKSPSTAHLPDLSCNRIERSRPRLVTLSVQVKAFFEKNQTALAGGSNGREAASLGLFGA